MENKFQKATRSAKKARILLRGTSGGGKTKSSLILASEFGKRIALVDTEKLSSTHNADDFDYDVLDYNDLTNNNHTPTGYIQIISEAEASGYDCLIIDSFSHVWMGRGGILEIVDNLTHTKYNGNSYRAWNDGNRLYQELINKVMYGNNMHIFLTARAKQAYEMVDRKVVKRGMETQQRDGLDYEFDISLDFNSALPGYATPDKDRTGVVSTTGEMVDKNFAIKLKQYYNKETL